MKRYLFSLFAAGLVIASCAVNEIDEAGIVQDTSVPVFASTETDTKTTIGPGEDGIYKVNWTEGDRILVMGSSNTTVYASQEGGKPTAAFLPEENAEGLDFTAGVIAGYPEKDMYFSSTDTEDPVYLTIPSTQTYCDGTFGDNVMPMISDVTYDNQLKFHNAAGVLKFMVSSSYEDVKVKNITVATTDGKAIGGECGYIPASKSYFFDDTMISSNTAQLDCGEGVSIGSEGKPFHIVVPHQEYTGLNIVITTTDGLQQTFTMKEGKTLNVKRANILRIPLVIDDLTDPTKPSVKLGINSISYTDFDFSIDISNTTAYFCGVQTKESFDNDIESGYLLGSLPYGTPYKKNLSYRGSILNFQEDMSENIFLEPGQTYVLWVVAYNSEKKYSVEDIHKIEVQMKSFTSGGSIEVSTSEHVITTEMISMTVSASKAMFIYCQLLSNEMLEAYSSDQEIIDALIRPNGIGVRIDKTKEYFERRQLKPGTDMNFIAVAIDKNGCYGPLLIEKYQTTSIDFNSLIVEIDKDVDKLKENGGVLNWKVSGGDAESYRYFYKKTDNNYWVSTYSQDYSLIEAKMVLDPGLFYFKNTSNSFATLSNPALSEGNEYVFIVLAVAEDGSCSKADHWIFTY